MAALVRPAWARSSGCKSPAELATARQAKRNCARETERGEEAWSVNRESRYTNRIRGDAGRGEQASDCEALVAKGRATYMRRLCGEGLRALTPGDLALCLKAPPGGRPALAGLGVLMRKRRAAPRFLIPLGGLSADEEQSLRTVLRLAKSPGLQARTRPARRSTQGVGLGALSTSEGALGSTGTRAVSPRARVRSRPASASSRVGPLQPNHRPWVRAVRSPSMAARPHAAGSSESTRRLENITSRWRAAGRAARRGASPGTSGCLAGALWACTLDRASCAGRAESGSERAWMGGSVASAHWRPRGGLVPAGCEALRRTAQWGRSCAGAATKWPSNALHLRRWPAAASRILIHLQACSVGLIDTGIKRSTRCGSSQH